jgi:hypothetical protein
MRQVTPMPFNVYEFNELSDEAKKTAYDILKDIMVDDRFNWYHDEATMSIEEGYGLKDVKVSYSLSSSQGDGFNFTVKTFNSNMINALILEDKEVSQDLKNNIVKLNELKVFNIFIKDNGTRYCYAIEHQVEVEVNEDYEDLLPDYLVKQIQEVYADVYMMIARQYEKDGYGLYDVSMDDVAEFAEINGYEFMEDGRQF